MSAFYVANGVNHFISPDVYLQIIPDFVPAPLAVVYVSGLAEILLGVGVLFGPTRMMAAWGLIVLLLVVVPANINVAVNDLVFLGEEPNSLVNWLRLPVQAVLIVWAWWHTRSDEPRTGLVQLD